MLLMNGLKKLEKAVFKTNEVRNQAIEDSESKITLYDVKTKEQGVCFKMAYDYLNDTFGEFFTADDVYFYNNYDFKNFVKEFNQLPTSQESKEQILDEALQYGVEFGY